MGRLFWTFPDGLPGVGLLVMRLVTASALLASCRATWQTEPLLPAILCAVEIIAAALLLAGLSTPISGGAAAAVELWRADSNPADALVRVLLATLGAALALLGPGAYSADARIFGWRRIDVPAAREEAPSTRKVRRRVSNGSPDDSN